ncbi:heme ABC transporter ATP-binding protein [Ancylobacter pratisalsi]|uniref:Heme ABC transporter ATP-binding protein n=1 Tax=Ancylobacter pratisalsi TaxID=1745854 RepID=A0A6P1YRQ0_9HYPH|nr:heme ABC transporter ATP-binding protein [Ancylobacter pratisalsi]QIB35560.1 heme ABC transporter ATP-binding protein [Ancylobacter pratisalsi]
MYRAHGITFRLGGRALLTDAGAAITPGRVSVLIGPNGAGKSTLLKVMAGELRPQSGHVLLDGADISTLPPARLAMLRAVVPQHAQIAFPFTVAEVVAIGAGSDRIGSAPVARALKEVELSGFEQRPYDRLSGGERQRVQLARALAQLDRGRSAGYLLLDEPTASLDLAQQVLVVRLMRRLAAERGIGILAVLHDLNLAAMAADHITALKNGHVVACGTPKEILTDAAIGTLYGVPARVSWAPETPFLLPQSIVD